MSGTKLHRAVIEFARLIYDPYLRIKYRYKFEKVDYRKGNFIALANHTTNLDSMFLGISFKQHMYFVAGEQEQKNIIEELKARGAKYFLGDDTTENSVHKAYKEAFEYLASNTLYDPAKGTEVVTFEQAFGGE